MDVIDNEYTNFNGLEGARTLKEALNSSVVIRSVDLDSQFSLTGQKYDVIFFLGTLYHLKNPYFVLESLARMTKYCFVSTRIAKETADGQPLSSYPLAYLLGPQECNNDDTNFWIFSDHGLKRLIDRTGWNLLSYVTIGDTASSTPADPERDERAFCLLEKRPPFLSASPNPVPASEGAGKTTVSWDTCRWEHRQSVCFHKRRQRNAFCRRAAWLCSGQLDRNGFQLRVSPLQFRSHRTAGKNRRYKSNAVTTLPSSPIVRGLFRDAVYSHERMPLKRRLNGGAIPTAASPAHSGFRYRGP